MIESKIAVIHDSAGKILRVCNGSKEGVELTVQQDGRDHVYVDSYPDMENSYIANGKVVAMPTKPSENCNFNYGTKAWDYDLTGAKREAWIRVKLSREADECGTFTWSDNTFLCDEHSLRNLMLTMQRALIDSSLSMAWTLADNTVKTFSSADYLNIGTAMSTHINACHEKAKGLRTKINAATTQDELDAITY